MKNIVVTGIGTISPLGIGFNDYQDKYVSKDAAIFEDIDIDELCMDMDVRRNDRFTKFGLAAFRDLVKHFKYFDIDPDGRGIIANTYFGPVNTVNDFLQTAMDGGLDQASPMLFSNTVINAGLGRISIEYKLKGISYMLCGSNPLYYAIKDVRENCSQVVFAGGIDDTESQLAFTRNGEREFYESSSFIGLEQEGSAKKRGAEIMARIHGVGMASIANQFECCDISSEYFYRAMDKALHESGVEEKDIRKVYLCSTEPGMETEAVNRLFQLREIHTPDIVYSRDNFRKYLSAGEFFTLFDGIIDMTLNNITVPAIVNIKALNCITSIVISR